MDPDISVVLAVRNGAGELRRTLDSIVSQARVSLEIVAVDDGSTDSTAQILSDYARRGLLAKVVSLEQAGLTQALIVGCRHARAPIIARQDCGDRSYPERLSLQRELLSRHESVGLVSCHTRYVGPAGEFLYEADCGVDGNRPVNMVASGPPPRAVGGPSHHGSAMFRKSLYDAVGGYRGEFLRSQDWDLWYRMSERARFAKIPAVLYEAVVSPGGISMAGKAEQDRYAEAAIAAMQARRLRGSDRPVLQSLAAQASNIPVRAKSRAAGNYFIGSLLAERGDPRCRSYLLAALQSPRFALPALWKIARTILR
jgi:glycosyltransferase involved in cell wall biosynthesis